MPDVKPAVYLPQTLSSRPEGKERRLSIAELAMTGGLQARLARADTHRAMWAVPHERKRLREAAIRDALIQFGGRGTLERNLVPRLSRHWEEILGRRLADGKVRELSHTLAESMAAEWPSVHATTSTTPDEFVDYSVERWAQALREKASLSWEDVVAFPVFVWGLIEIALTNQAGWPNWWQALPMSVPAAYLITLGFLWLRKKGYTAWEE